MTLMLVLDQPDKATDRREQGKRRRRVRLAALETVVMSGMKGSLTNSSTNEREERETTTTLGVCWMWRRKSFSSAMLQDSLQRSTAGRPQLRGQTETGEQRTPRTAV